MSLGVPYTQPPSYSSRASISRGLTEFSFVSRIIPSAPVVLPVVPRYCRYVLRYPPAWAMKPAISKSVAEAEKMTSESGMTMTLGVLSVPIRSGTMSRVPLSISPLAGRFLGEVISCWSTPKCAATAARLSPL